MKRILVLMICMLLLTACQKQGKDDESENSTRISNSVVGTWYQVTTWDYVDVWEFTSDGKHECSDEDNYIEFKEHRVSGGYHYTYTLENDNLVIKNRNGREIIKEYKVRYTEYGLELLYVDGTGKPEMLYESRQEALEACKDYRSTPTYFKSIADEDGFVIEDGVLIRYVGDAKEITIPSNVERMGKLCMWGEKLRKVTIPGTVKVIESAAFHSEMDYRYIYIEEGVEEIGAGAFPELIEIHFPASVKKMGTNVFDAYEGIDEDMKIYVKKGSYAHEYFIESGLEEQLIFEE
ncbi:MAG: leucine-rich repeat protein [Lachnospiraceae bacterium]|nr:leucine-rich repeat protein [Lachnospiraceae bacterium]